MQEKRDRKDFTSEFQRKVRFINELTSDNQRRWKIEALTLGEGKAGTHMNIEKLIRIIPHITNGITEIYTHPATKNNHSIF